MENWSIYGIRNIFGDFILYLALNSGLIWVQNNFSIKICLGIEVKFPRFLKLSGINEL